LRFRDCKPAGIRLEALRLVIPPTARTAGREARERRRVRRSRLAIVARLDKTTVYLLENVASEVSATDIRRKASRGQSIHGLVSHE